MHAYNTSETFQTWNVLDSFFRGMPSGTLLRVDRRDDSPGKTVITHGSYEKDRGKDGSFELVDGLPMFFYEDGSMAGGTVSSEDPSQFVYPDEMISARGIQDLRFRILKLGNPGAQG